jgi:hypothetical protein
MKRNDRIGSEVLFSGIRLEHHGALSHKYAGPDQVQSPRNEHIDADFIEFFLGKE